MPSSSVLPLPDHASGTRLLTPRLAAQIALRVARGIPVETVAQQLRITARVIYDWQAQGRSSLDASSLQFRLVHAIAHARAHREWHTLRDIDRIADWGEKDSDKLKALTWRLERHPAYRDRYGIHVDVEHRGTVDHRLKQLEQLDDANLLEIAPPDLKALLEPDT
jgi:hypothetical protein